MITRINIFPNGVETLSPLAGLSGVCLASGARRAYGAILGTKKSSYNSNESETKAVIYYISRDDTDPHGVETPTLGIPVLTGAREAGAPQPLGASRFSSFINRDLMLVRRPIINCEHIQHGSPSTTFAWRSQILLCT